MVEQYEVVPPNAKDSFIKGLIVAEAKASLGENHKPPYDFNIFVPWIQDIISSLAFYLGLENNREVGANILQFIWDIHYVNEPIRYNFGGHVVQSMQEKLALIKRGNSKTFRFTT